MSKATEDDYYSCNSRNLSWFKNSCLPNPNPNHHHRITTIVKPPPTITPISLLPDDLLLECLSRASLSSLPALPLVCRRWSLLLHSPSFLALRRRLHLLHPTLFSLLTSLRFATLRSAAWKTASFSLPNNSQIIINNSRLVAIGPKIYVIGRGATVGCDTWTGKVTIGSGMIYSRKKFAAGVVGGKIYVAGGAARTSAVEEYDPGNDTWHVVSEAPRRRYGCLGTSEDGIFYIIGGLKIGQQNGTQTHHVYASSMDLYDVKTSTWLRTRAVPGGGCIVAACSAEGHIYVLLSHAVEISFWRFDGRRHKSGKGSFGEWTKLKSPRLQNKTRLDNRMRFSCVGVGNKVVVVQVGGCGGDLARRRERVEGGGATKRALAGIYDCEGGEWSKGPDIPDGVLGSAFFCVEC